MAKKLDDNALAKSDTVERPDVTDNTPAPQKPEAAKVDQAALANDEETTARNSRIAAGALAKGYQHLTGEQANTDQLEALSEITLKLFKALRAVPFGGFWGGSIVAFCIALPFLPPIIKFLKPVTTKGEKTNAQAA